MNDVSETVQGSSADLDMAAGPESGPNPRTLPRRAGAIFLRQREASVLAIAVALVIYFAVSTPDFFTRLNLSDISYGTAAFAIIAIGEVMLLTCGEIDLSVGQVWTL